jgi:hypothetical protein
MKNGMRALFGLGAGVGLVVSVLPPVLDRDDVAGSGTLTF